MQILKPGNNRNSSRLLRSYNFCTPAHAYGKNDTAGFTCEEIVTKIPDYTEIFIGESSPNVQPFNHITISNICCDITVYLDDAIISIPSQVNHFERKFVCKINSLEIEGDCIDDIVMTVSCDGEMETETVCVQNPVDDDQDLIDSLMNPCATRGC